MAKMVLTAAFVSLSGTDVSGSTTKCELAVEVEDKDVTTFASAGWKESLGGLKAGTISLTLLQDPAAGQLDSMMWPLIGSVVPFEVRLANAAASASNPRYTGSMLVKTWKPVAGAVGDVASVDVQYPTSGAVIRATA